MKPRSILILAIVVILSGWTPENAVQRDVGKRRISAEEYRDKVYASWLGQLVGNFYGLPHKNVYVDEPRPDSLSEFKYRGWHLDRMRE